MSATLSETAREPFEKLLAEWADKAHNAPTALEAHRVLACMTDLRNLLDKIPGPHAGSDGGPPPAVAQGAVHDAAAEDGERGDGSAAVIPLAVEPGGA